MTISHESLVAYLKERRDDLSLLTKDLQCKPFSAHREANALVVAVDWSEVHAYAFAGPPPRGETMEAVLGSPMTRAMHQAALSVIFDRTRALDGDLHNRIPLLLLPSYVSEMVSFLRIIAEHHLEHELHVWERDKVMQSLADSSARHSLLQLAQDLANKDDEEFDLQLRERFKEQDVGLFKGWVETEFAGLYMLAKVSAVSAMEALSYLTRGTADRQPPLATIADLSPRLSKAVASLDVTAESRPWRGRLLRNGHWRPGSPALLTDAEAIVLLAFLNAHFHGEGKQLVFVTSRGGDMDTVMRAHTGLFACLSDHYLPTEPALPVPIIRRSWRHFFELGVVCETSQLEHALQWAEQRLDDVQSKLEIVTNQRARDHQIHQDLLRETRDDFQNLQAMLSVERPWLPCGKTETVDQRAVRVFITWVSDPDIFGRQRSELRQKLDAAINVVQTHFPFEAYDNAIASAAFPDWYKPLTRALLEKYTLGDLLQDIRVPKFRKLCGKAYRAIKAGTIPQHRDEVSSALRTIKLDPSSSEPEHVDLTRLAITMAYACGAFHRLKYLIDQFSQQQMRGAQLGPRWVVLKVMHADLIVVHSSQSAADGLLRQAWHDSLGETGTAPREPKFALGLLNAWLLLHLDWTEWAYGEDLCAYPPWGDEKLELEYIMGEMERNLKGFEQVLPRELTRSVSNNLVYAAARLAPIPEEALFLATVLGSSRERRWRSYLRDERILSRVNDMSKYAISRLRPFELDTLGYYYLKRAYWAGIGREGVGDAKRAERFFTKAREKAEATKDRRTANAAERHQDLLRRLQRIFAPQPALGGTKGFK